MKIHSLLASLAVIAGLAVSAFAVEFEKKTITTDFHINMRTINVTSEDGIFKGTLELYVYDRKELDDLFKALRKLEAIKEVKRVTGEN